MVESVLGMESVSLGYFSENSLDDIWQMPVLVSISNSSPKSFTIHSLIRP